MGPNVSCMGKMPSDGKQACALTANAPEGGADLSFRTVSGASE